MKLARVSAVVAAVAIAPAVLFSSPAVAADTVPATAASTPDKAAEATPEKKPETKPDAGVKDKPAKEPVKEPAKEPGKEAAKADEDNFIAILRMLKGAGPTLYEAAQAALKGTPEDRVRFLEDGQHFARLTDLRLRVTRTTNGAGHHVKEAAKVALDSDSMEDLQHYLDVGQYEARAKDEADAAAAKEKADKDKADAEKAEKDKAEKDKSEAKDDNGKQDAKGDQQKPATVKPAVAAVSDNAAKPAGDTTELASTGAGSATPWAIGGTAAALATGAALVLTARRRMPSER
ncbi:ALF repeat-containing protein [Streptomyces olivoreticuli]|uniref:ALF repeat-containing protein n=1 Tax=Streptomyces olivoreticuli TaxID=68246 RepID=UPI0013C2FA4C|nr:ALF repeat-containing protein [Streptomyces olivoreticuli]